MEPPSRTVAQEASLSSLDDVGGHVVAGGVKEAQALRRFDTGCVISLESVARGARIDEVVERIGAARRQRMEVVNLELTATDVSDTSQ